MKGFSVHDLGRLRKATAIGLISLLYNPARYESGFRIGTAPNRRLKNED